MAPHLRPTDASGHVGSLMVCLPDAVCARINCFRWRLVASSGPEAPGQGVRASCEPSQTSLGPSGRGSEAVLNFRAQSRLPASEPLRIRQRGPRCGQTQHSTVKARQVFGTVAVHNILSHGRTAAASAMHAQVSTQCSRHDSEGGSIHGIGQIFCGGR
ncbi:hypothetical protein GUJ93_ZPchr0015g6648 [Zizania palustris]|uniref:Uncharacterized protein n=1 Tax=Zizania palustris TaxID=103762 RepID=A0A8J5SYR0_ZIZPA|nr:hypothetical protein GUJ93_ZPchr0015g6648 [Zizania palustris]